MMAAIAFYEMRRDVLRYAPQAPSSLMIDVLCDAARDFFSKSTAWRRDITLTLEDGTDTYDLLNPDLWAAPFYDEDAELFLVDISSIHEVVYDTGQDAKKLDKQTAAKVASHLPVPTQQFWGYRNPTKSSIKLIPAPGPLQDGKTLTVSVSLVPARRAKSLADDEMADLYQCQIAGGATALLLKLPGQPWTDQRLSEQLEKQFEEDIMEASNRIQTEHSPHIVRTVGYGGL